MVRSGLSAITIAGVTLLGLSHNAHAAYPVTVVNPWAGGMQAQVQDTGTKAAVDDAKSTIKAAVDTMNQQLKDALRSFSGQQTANFQQRTQADASLRETQDNRGVQQHVEVSRYNAALAVSSGAAGCNILTGVVGSTGLINTAVAARTQLTRLTLGYQLGEDRDSSLRNGTQAAIKERLDAVCSSFSTQGMIDEGICTGSPTQPPAADGKPSPSDSLNADVILNNRVLNSKQQEAARIFVSNAFIPSPIAPIPKSLADTAEGRSAAANRWTSGARNSIAQVTLNEVIASRIPISNDDKGDNKLKNLPTANVGGTSTTTPTTTVKQWAEGTAKGMLGGKPDGQNYPDGISLWAWLDLRARSFYLDPNFMVTINHNSADQNTKDSVLIQGYQTYLQWEQFKQQERTNVLLATMVSMMDQQMSNQPLSGSSPR